MKKSEMIEIYNNLYKKTQEFKAWQKAEIEKLPKRVCFEYPSENEGASTAKELTLFDLEDTHTISLMASNSKKFKAAEALCSKKEMGDFNPFQFLLAAMIQGDIEIDKAIDEFYELVINDKDTIPDYQHISELEG